MRHMLVNYLIFVNVNVMQVEGIYSDLKGRASDAVTSGQQKVGVVKGRASDAAASGQQKASNTVEGARTAVTPPKVRLM